MTNCGGPDEVRRTGSVQDGPVGPRPSVPLPPPWPPGRLPVPYDARSEATPVDTAQLATLLSAIAHHEPTHHGSAHPGSAHHGTAQHGAVHHGPANRGPAQRGAPPRDPADADRPGGLGLYVVANRVDGLDAGVYRYRPRANSLIPVEAAQPAGRLASCAAEPAPLLAADAVLGFAADAGRGGPRRRHEASRAPEDGLAPVKSAYRAVRSADALGLTGTVVAGFVDAIGELLGLPAGNPCCVLVALTRTAARHH